MQLALSLPAPTKAPPTDRTPTFVDNMKLPVHGWFRYSAGFSAAWVVELLRELKAERGNLRVLDPFAGVGTTLLAAEEAGLVGLGVEAHPFVERVAQAKLLWNEHPEAFLEFATDVLRDAVSSAAPDGPFPRLLTKCYSPDALADLYRLRSALTLRKGDGPLVELTWLALASVLRICSPVGTAPWQYILPNATKARVVAPFQAFHTQALKMAADMGSRQRDGVAPSARIHPGDARDLAPIESSSVDVVITSPPYANNYDYADATRLEMTFFEDLTGWGQLATVRKRLVHSCSQHASGERLNLESTLSTLETTPIIGELREVCAKLALERLGHGGKKDYHLMVAAYFSDLHRVWQALRRVSRENSKVCFVIGDSAPYGIYVPVDRWLGELALHSGFKSYTFEKRRDRNTKWKNRKHTVPLHEGNLWVEA